MARKLGAGGFQRDMSTQEILEVVQGKVNQYNTKTVFNSLDDNRTGRISVRELVTALREMEILIPDAKAEEIVKELNARVGDDSRTHISYRAFAGAFHKDAHDGTTGATHFTKDEEKLIPNVDHHSVWHAKTPGESMPAANPTARRLVASQRAHSRAHTANSRFRAPLLAAGAA